MRYVLFHKPYGVLTQFTSESGNKTLKDFIPIPDIYPVGRLDKDSEGLLLLTDDGALQHRWTHPRHHVAKTYWAQVEGVPTAEAIAALSAGVELNDGPTRPAQARLLPADPGFPPRDPPIRFRQSIPTSWLELILTEGRNRQVRRMTASVGFPTLRLVRVRIGALSIEGLPPGQWREVKRTELDPAQASLAAPSTSRTQAQARRSPRPRS